MSRTRAAILVGGIVVAGAAAAYAYEEFDTLAPYGAMAYNYARYLNAADGTLTVEQGPAASEKAASEKTAQAAPVTTAPQSPMPAASDAAPPPAVPAVQIAPAATMQENPVADTTASEDARASTDWASYNKTLTSSRFSGLKDINTSNVGRMKVMCTYDTGQYTGFNSGLLEINDALIFTTEYDIFSIDPNDCRLNWRTHESYSPATPQGVSRGAAYLDGILYRGTQDGRVLAYDFKTGKRVWATQIADPKKGESAPAAPIAWNGLVFIGNAGGDIKGVKGRMYALDAKTGKIVWEFYLVPKVPGDPERGPEAVSPLNGATWKNPSGAPITGGGTWTSYTLDPKSGLLYVPGGNPAPDFVTGLREGSNLYSGSVVVLDAKTGAYKTHYKIVPKDWHDWDVSSAPALIHTAGGKDMMMVAPKDGHLYGFDLSTQKLVYRDPVTKVENAGKTFTAGQPVHFCPGSVGGAEWNGPAYDQKNNLVMVGEVQWCTTVTAMTDANTKAVKSGSPWSGEDSKNPFNTWGKQDPFAQWAGWVYAVDADTGAWRWRAKSNYPVQSGVTPTAGGVVFFGDMGGNFYALDANDGHKLWGQKIGGAIGGGVITYKTKGVQRVAVATGLTELIWPTPITTAKVSVLGVSNDKSAQR